MTGQLAKQSSTVGSIAAADGGPHGLLMLGGAAALGAFGAVAVFAALVWAGAQGQGSDQPLAGDAPASVETTAVARTATTPPAGRQAKSVHFVPTKPIQAHAPAPSDRSVVALDAGAEEVVPAERPVDDSLSISPGSVEAAEPAEVVLASASSEAGELATHDAAVTRPQPLSRTPRELARQLQERASLIEFDTNGKSMQALILASAKAKAKRQRGVLPKAAEEGAVADDDESALLRRLVARRSDTDGLAFRWGDECHAEEAHAEVLDEISKAIRAIPTNAPDRSAQIGHLIGMNSEWWIPEAVPAFEQMLQVESVDLRLKMLRILRMIFSPESTRAIVRRALYDLEPEVRLAAADALRNRPQEEYLPLLVDGLRYPWEAVAWNAADALAQLGDSRLADSLLEQLDQPPPTAPFQDEQGSWRVRELAALGHTQNCILCHAPSSQRHDRVRGLIPGTASRPSNMYYQSQGLVGGEFVRADITYLQQDFSVMQSIEPTAYVAGGAQRIDYVVRARKVTLAERVEAAEQARRPDNPHRQALLYTLRALTGLDEAALVARRQSS